MSRLKVTYQKDLMAALIKEFGFTSAMEVPRLDKIVLNIGLGEAIQNIKVLDSAMEEPGATARGDQSAQVHCFLQVAGGNAHRLHGDPPQNTDV